jgi:hypothetical protein
VIDRFQDADKFCTLDTMRRMGAVVLILLIVALGLPLMGGLGMHGISDCPACLPGHVSVAALCLAILTAGVLILALGVLSRLRPAVAAAYLSVHSSSLYRPPRAT